jgi:hypothetical protein
MAQATSMDPQAQAGLRRRAGMGVGVSVAARDIGIVPYHARGEAARCWPIFGPACCLG